MTTRQPRATGPARGGAGLTLAVLSAATFGISGTFGSSLIAAGWSPAAAVIARIAVAAVILTIPALLQLRGRWGLLRRGAGQAAAYGLVAVAGCQLFYFSAIQRIPVGVALLLEYLGVVLVLNLAGSAHVNPVGVIWGLLAAVGLAVYFLLSAAERAEPLPPIVMAWAAMCTGAAALAVLGWLGLLRISYRADDVVFLGHRVSWIVPVLGLSLVAAVIAYVAGIGAARRLGAKLASFIGLAEVLFAIAFAWLLLGQLPSPVQFAGGVFILAGVACVRVDELRHVPATEPAPRAAGPASTQVLASAPGARD